MKNVLYFVVSLFTVGAFAADPPTYQISCGATKVLAKKNDFYRVSISVKGKVVGRSSKPYFLNDYTVGYTVYQEDKGKLELFAKETITGDDLKYNPDYDAKKYVDHVQFKLPSKEGKIELIYPEKIGRDKKFKAHMIFTGVHETFGGTAHLKCSRKKID